VVEVHGGDVGRLIDGLVSKMSGNQVFDLAIIFLILYFSYLIGHEWIERIFDEKRREGDARERAKASEQETRRLAIFATALQHHPQMKVVSEMADQGREQLVRAVAAAERGQVLGTPLTQGEARTILAKQRDIGRGRRMDGHYEVVEIDIDNPDGYMGTLRNVRTNQQISVAINRAELADSDIETLFAALRQKTSIDAMVNAWMVGDKIASAHILRADPHEGAVTAPATTDPTNPPAPTP
jgi:Na+-transporting methylmalonyl-CoA/oxaloacetate decarboxylase gamma subunit